MEPRNPASRRLAASLFLVLSCWLGAVGAQEKKQPLPMSGGPVLAGHVTHLSGILSVKRADGQTKLLAVQSEVYEGDLLTTENAFARIKFVDDAELVVRPESQVVVDRYRYNEAKPEADNVAVSLLKGGLRAITGLLGKRNKENVKFNTPTATIGIRGTHFGALFCQNNCGGMPLINGKPPENGLHVDVASGAIVLSNGAGQVLINAGEFGFVPKADAPPKLVPAESGVKVIVPASTNRNDSSPGQSGSQKDGEC